MNCRAILLGIISSCLNFREAQATRKPLILNREGIVSEAEAKELLFESDIPKEVKNLIANFAYSRLKKEYEESDEWLLDRLNRLTIADNTIEYRRQKDNKILQFSLIDGGIKREVVDGLDELIIEIPLNRSNKDHNRFSSPWKLIGISPSCSKFLLLQHTESLNPDLGIFIPKSILWMYNREKALLKKIMDLGFVEKSYLFFQAGIADTAPYGVRVVIDKQRIARCFLFINGQDEGGSIDRYKEFKFGPLGVNVEIQSVSCSPAGSKFGIKIVDKEIYSFIKKTYSLIYDLKSNQLSQYIFKNEKWEKQEEKK